MDNEMVRGINIRVWPVIDETAGDPPDASAENNTDNPICVHSTPSEESNLFVDKPPKPTDDLLTHRSVL